MSESLVALDAGNVDPAPGERRMRLSASLDPMDAGDH
jgi:hypothetical protein